MPMSMDTQSARHKATMLLPKDRRKLYLLPLGLPEEQPAQKIMPSGENSHLVLLKVEKFFEKKN
jgi:hypothetical protein